MVLIYSDLNKTQIYKMPYRDRPHHEIELLMSLNCLKVFRPNEHKQDYHFRKTNEESFLFAIQNSR